MNKINEIKIKITNFLEPKLFKVNEKIKALIPNDKLRKTLYIAVTAFFSIFVILILLGLAVGGKKTNTQTGTLINKPKIEQSQTKTPEPNLTERDKEIMDLENKTRSLKFPPSELTPPDILMNITI